MKRRSRHSGCNPFFSMRALIGNDVYNLDTDELGAIQDIVLDMHTGRVGFAVLRCRIDPLKDDKLVAVPWHKLTLDKQLHCFVLDLSIERLRAAPALDLSHVLPRTAAAGEAARLVPATHDRLL